MSVDLFTAQWLKSSHSGAGKDCVEIAHLAKRTVGVRDSKNPTGPVLLFTPGEWDAFTTGLQEGKFERPA
ncbi:DUF397 domain-containing protein [Nocardia nova]|uniref:DUF397 domain-containing protein n=1 Tax=Nocardia nova TaxID=37330 RepID=UPI000CEA3819|nr:DUF397 domain-containing protein [Nocardia nova]